MNKSELLARAYPIIKKIARNRRGQSFAYYEACDIEQEVWMFCLQALDRYDPSKASAVDSIDKKIEHFLNRHVSNRLKNLMRDRYFRPEPKGPLGQNNSETRMNLINALPIDIFGPSNIKYFLALGSDASDPASSLIAEETIAYIRKRLSEDLLEHFEDLIGGNKLRRSVEMVVQEEVAQILQEMDND